jgi:hypothetical protein
MLAEAELARGGILYLDELQSYSASTLKILVMRLDEMAQEQVEAGLGGVDNPPKVVVSKQEDTPKPLHTVYEYNREVLEKKKPVTDRRGEEPLPFNKRAEAGLLDAIGKELADKSRQVELQSPTKTMSIKEQFLFQASKMAQDLAQGKSKEDAIALFKKQAEPKLAAMAEKAYDGIQQRLAQLKAKAEDNFETMPESGGRIATKDLKHGEKYALRRETRPGKWKESPVIYQGTSRGRHIFEHMGGDGSEQYILENSERSMLIPWTKNKEAKPEAAEKQRPRLAEQMASIGATAVGGKPEKKAVSGKPSSFPLGDAEWDLLSKLKAAGDHSAEAKKLLKENPDTAFKLKENTMIGLFAGGLNTDVTDKFFAEKQRPRLAEQMASIGATAVGGKPEGYDAALLADYHEATGAYSVGAIKKINARAQELLPGIRVQEARDVVAMASEHGGKLPAEFVEQMIRENRVIAQPATASEIAAGETEKAAKKKKAADPKGKTQRYQAYLAATKAAGKEPANWDFMDWVTKKWSEYEKQSGEKMPATKTTELQDKFDKWLSSGAKPAEPEKKAVGGKPSSFPLGDAEWELLSKLKAAGDHSAEAKKLLKENPDAAFKLKENTMIGLFAGGLNTDVTDKFFAEKKEAPKTMTEVVKEATKEGLQPNIDKDKPRKVPSLDGATYHDTLDVDDYPYGRERTKAKFSVETMKNGNQRGVMQTLNPKTGRWNKPKKTTSGKKVKIVQVGGKTYIATDHGQGSIHLQNAAGFKSAGYVYGESGSHYEEGVGNRFVPNAKASDPGHHELHVGIHGKSEAQKYADLGIRRKGEARPPTTTGKPRTDVVKEEKKAPESRGMLSNEDRLKEIHNDGYLSTPAPKVGNKGGEENDKAQAESHAAHEKQHKELVEAGHVEHLGHGVYADKAPPKAAKGKTGTVTIKRGGDKEAKVPGTTYGKGDWAITRDPEEKGKSRVTHVASGLGFGSDMSGPQASYTMDHLMEMEGKGELEGFDAKKMSGSASKKATDAIKKLNDHLREESNSYNPIWSRRNKAKREANRRGKVADAEKTVADTAGRKSKPMSEATKKHASVESAHKRSSQFESGDETRPSLMQSYVDEHQGERHMVSTDGHRLAMIPVSKDVAEGHYKPKKEGRKKVGLDHQKPGSYDADTFPDYTKIIPQNMTKENTHTFDAEALHAQAHLASTNASGSTTVMHLFTDEGGSHAQGSHTAAYSPHADEKDGDMHGQRHTAAEPYKGKEKGVTFNPRYLKDALEGAKGPVEVHYTGELSGAIHVKRGDGERHIIMPMRADKLPPKHPHNPATGRASTKKSLNTFTDLVKNIDTVRSYMAEGMPARAATKKAYPTYSEAKVDKFLKQYGLNKALSFTKLVQQSPKIYHRRQPGKYGSK